MVVGVLISRRIASWFIFFPFAVCFSVCFCLALVSFRCCLFLFSFHSFHLASIFLRFQFCEILHQHFFFSCSCSTTAQSLFFQRESERNLHNKQKMSPFISFDFVCTALLFNYFVFLFFSALVSLVTVKTEFVKHKSSNCATTIPNNNSNKIHK